MTDAPDATWIVGNDPHEHDEDPMDCIGPEIPDPWHDPTQTDWPNEKVNTEVTN